MSVTGQFATLLQHLSCYIIQMKKGFPCSKMYTRAVKENTMARSSKSTERRASGRTIGIAIAVLLVAAIVLVNLFGQMFQLVRYYGDGMEPTLQSGRTLMIRKTDKISEGDVIAFYYNNKLLVRRVICTGGKQLSIERDGTVLIDGQTLDEPYIAERTIGQCNLEFPCYVSPGTVFVMGDNRAISMDSRLKEIGTIAVDRILGKVLFVD